MADDQRDDAEPDGEQLTRTASAESDESAATDSSTTDATASDDAAAADDAVSRDVDSSATGADAGASTDVEDGWLEDSAESFVELEAELGSDDSPPDRARVVGAETVPASEVPADYPRRIETGQALALGLALAGSEETATAYFAWPPADEDAPLSRLLGALSIPADSFADLNGRQLLVTVEDGYVRPIVPPVQQSGSEHGLAGILGGHAAMAGLLGAAMLGTIQLPALLLGGLLITVVVLPVATFLDARHLQSTTDWDQSALFWSILQMLPGANLLVTAAYLVARRGARALDRS